MTPPWPGATACWPKASGDPAWLAGLEDGMARHAVAATAARRRWSRASMPSLAEGAVAPFPAANSPCSARSATGWPQSRRSRSRTGCVAPSPPHARRMPLAGGSSLGAHRADFGMSDLATGRPAGLASTGQQKTLLLGMVLGHALVIAEARGFAPWLLLDEPLVHLDDGHRASLLDALLRLPAQSFLTGTDAAPFMPLRDHAEFLHCMAADLSPEPGFARPDNQKSL